MTDDPNDLILSESEINGDKKNACQIKDDRALRVQLRDADTEIEDVRGSSLGLSARRALTGRDL